MDDPTYYDAPSPSSSSDSDVYFTDYITTNSGNKHAAPAQWSRRGKISSWGLSYEEGKSINRARKRMRLCLERVWGDAAAAIGEPVPKDIIEREERRKQKRQEREEQEQFVLPHLKESRPIKSVAELAHNLRVPNTYLEVMTNPALADTLSQDGAFAGLQETTGDLLDGEKRLLQVLGRLREVMRLREMDVAVIDRPEKTGMVEEAADSSPEANGDTGEPVDPTSSAQGPTSVEASKEGQKDPSKELIPPLPHISDTDNLWRVKQELIATSVMAPPTISYSITEPGTAKPPAPYPAASQREPTAMHRLFTHPQGITITADPSPNHHGYAHPTFDRRYPKVIKYNLDMKTQCRAVDDALERVGELLADVLEHKDRLEEVRERVADVGRAKKRIWGIVKARAAEELDGVTR